jgi:hypothetical protein
MIILRIAEYWNEARVANAKDRVNAASGLN